MQKQLGQYFTIAEELQQFVFDKVKHKGSRLLEPSFGAGHLLQPFKQYDANYPMVCYELDTTIQPVVEFNAHQMVVYGDFTKQTIQQRFKTIVGNPPYVKQKTGNLYIQFIELCFNLLEEDGELIFIVPSDFLKVTRAAPLISAMAAKGCFTDFLFPHNEKLFEGASIDVVVFRYEKGSPATKCLVNGKEMVYTVQEGILTFRDVRDAEIVGTPLDSKFQVIVGLVSGRDEIYRVPFGNVSILQDKDKVQTFIFTETFPTQSPQINAHLLAHKEELLARKIRSFSDTNWFEWGAPRNLRSIKEHFGTPCIYVRNLTRNKEVAFVGTVQMFGGALLCLIPKTEERLEPIVQYLNSPVFQKEYLYAGRFKIGQKQLCNVMLPA